MMTMSDEGDRMCPLCAEEMDLTDQQLKPCKCGYEICVWCWHHIIEMAEKDDTEGRCPACRTPYDKERIVGTAVSCERMVADLNSEKKLKSQKTKSKTSEGRKHLSSVRVIQRNLVYVIGIPADLADEDILERKEFFGQYGKVLKVSITRSAGSGQQSSNNGTVGTCSVYITYTKEEEAVRCIQSVHGFALEGRPLRACFGTTKYCHAWLRNMPCSNPDCLYLHEVGTQEDSFTKDEIISAYTRSRVQQLTGTAYNSQKRSGNVLPPPVDDFSSSGTASSAKSTLKNGSNNPPQSAKGSPPNSSSGRSSILPAAASWGLRATSCGSQANNSISQALSKPNSLSGFSVVASSTNMASSLNADSVKGSGMTEVCGVNPSVSSGTLGPSNQSTNREFQTVDDAEYVMDATSVTSSSDSSTASVYGDKSTSVSTTSKNLDYRVLPEQQSASDHVLPRSRSYSDRGLQQHRVENGSETFTSKSYISRSDTGSENEALSRDPKMDKSVPQAPVLPAVGKESLDVLLPRSVSHIGDSEGQYVHGVDTSGTSFPEETTSRVGVSNGALNFDSCKVICPSGSIDRLPNGEGDQGFGRVARGVFETDQSCVPDMESSIISSILSLDLDSWDEPLTSPHDLAKMLNESDRESGSIAFPGSLKTHTSSQSKFSFAREDDFVSQSAYLEPSSNSYNVNMQKVNLSQGDGSENRSFYGDKVQNGFRSHSFEDSDSLMNCHPLFPSTKVPVSRTQISAPPGFSVPSRAPPPGFSSQDRQYRSFDTSLGSQPHEIMPSRNQYQMPSGNISSIADVEFIDPAILAVGKGKLPLGVMNSGIDTPSSYSPLLNSTENDLRLRLLMQQQSLSTHQNFRYTNPMDNRFSPSNDGYVNPRFDGSNQSHIAQMSLHQARNSHLSNGHWDSWNEAHTGNELGGVAELLRNEGLGFNKYMSGYDELKYRMSSSGDLYNRAFGM